MKIKVTGDMRDIANSAWISTIDEIRAATRDIKDVKRVVGFLVENHHTSPFECVTISFIADNDKEAFTKLNAICHNNFSREHLDLATGKTYVTIDLLNFIKVIKNSKYHGINSESWRLFKEIRPELAEMLLKFGPIEEHKMTPEDVDQLLGDHNMDVQFVSLHDVGVDHCSRATWRVKCPLSIAVQMLRHRKASYNMVSGRYRTVLQELVEAADDCQEIFEKFGMNLDKYLGVAEGCIAVYRRTMREAKKARDGEVISNEEYKRLREFARFILPEGRITELYVTYYLDDFYNNFVKLRNSTHAQLEHVWVAQEMEKTLEAAR